MQVTETKGRDTLPATRSGGSLGMWKVAPGAVAVGAWVCGGVGGGRSGRWVGFGLKQRFDILLSILLGVEEGSMFRKCVTKYGSVEKVKRTIALYKSVVYLALIMDNRCELQIARCTRYV